NRRLARATVKFRGSNLELRRHDRLVYAALHHNWVQEYRVLFAAPVEGIRGIDVVECPSGTPPCLSRPVAGESRAYLLNRALERTTELAVTEVRLGN
ncbi:MAG: hypothetical protein O7J95_03000, partial [Planctomycetota bacterium]|nr:hypothetical protein [Planctomycetota bacterium]